MEQTKDESNIIPIAEYDSIFHLVDASLTAGVRMKSEEMYAEAGSIIWNIAFPRFRDKVYNMSSLETSLVVRAFDCFAPMDSDLYEFTCLHWLGVLNELQQFGDPSIRVMEEKKKGENLSFRFSMSERVTRRYKMR